MKNTDVIPFERNRYYAGKMLTSSDFLAEQIYNNNKRRFINQTVVGSGILCGCSVFWLDDLSVLVESGAAIDSMGREIVIENSVVKKLSAISGFEGLRTNQAVLCLRYQERDVHAVYTVNRQENESEYEYNRVAEGYELFLMDEEDTERSFELDTEFFAVASLMDHPDYEIKFRIPAVVCAGKYVRAELVITKKSERVCSLDYEAVVQMPGFAGRDGLHELRLSADKVLLKQGETLVKDYWIKTESDPATDTFLVIKAGTAQGTVDEVKADVNGDMNLQVQVSEIQPKDLALRESEKLSLEMRRMGMNQDYIPLAVLSLVRTETAYIIEGIQEQNVKKYIPTLAEKRRQEEYQEYFRDEWFEQQQPPETQGAMGQQIIREHQGAIPEIETGILEIPLNANARKGEVRYSGEIMHGLGKGNVYVEIGYERLEDNPVHGANTKSTIYGNPDLFQEDNSPDVCVETAVKVLNDMGSFVVAVRFLKDVDFLILTFRWVAMKFPSGENLLTTEDISNKRITAATPTVVLGTKESYYFDVEFNNMKSCSVAYELTEPGSGEVTPDGIYTAPSKEGVYEIRIYCTDMPMICTYAYAIVKKRGIEQTEKG